MTFTALDIRATVAEIVEEFRASGIKDIKKKKAMEFFQAKTAELKNVNETATRSIITGATISSMIPGSMLMFQYDAKDKKTLKYWDRYPLVFPIHPYNDGFLGLNLHYVNLTDRAKLFSALLQTADEKEALVRIKISYEILKNTSKMRAYKPCLKRYLSDHLKSKFFYINYTEWPIYMLLPTQRFLSHGDQYYSYKDVWADSSRIMKKGK